MDNQLANTIQHNMVTAMFILDEALVIHYANSAAEQLFAQNTKRIVNHPLSHLIQHASLDLNLFTQPLQSGQSITDSDVTFVVDGKPLLLEVTVTPLSWQKKVMLLMEMRKVEQQRRLSQELNQHAQQQAANLLIRGLAHEIKNPLGGLRGAAQLLEKKLPDTELKEYTQIIIEQSDRLRLLVDRLLGPQKLSPKRLENIHMILEKVRQLVELSTSTTLTIVRDYDPSLPDILISADQIEQALLNIVNNAAQILSKTDNAQITLRTRTVHQTNIHGHKYKLAARIDIIDNGPGIAESIQDTLFYPMVSTQSNGTGLGLSISQNLIDQHNGKIEVDSWPGQTTFTIYLPFT